MSFSIDRRLFYGLLTALAFAAALAGGVWFGRSGGSPAAGTGAPVAPGAVPPAGAPAAGMPTANPVVGNSPADDPQFADLKRIEVADAFARFEKKDALFVDSRSADQFALGHIPDSVNIPFTEAATRFKELPTDKDVIVYAVSFKSPKHPTMQYCASKDSSGNLLYWDAKNGDDLVSAFKDIAIRLTNLRLDK